MDTSIASLNRSTFEERQKNVTYLRSLYFLVAIQLLTCVGWCLIVVNSPDLAAWIKRWWGIALAVAIIAVILLLAVYFVPALNSRGAGFGIYFLFTLCLAYLWGYFSSLNLHWNYGWFVLLLLTAIAIGFAAYTW